MNTSERINDERLAEFAGCQEWWRVWQKNPDEVIIMARELQQARARIAELEQVLNHFILLCIDRDYLDWRVRQLVEEQSRAALAKPAEPPR